MTFNDIKNSKILFYDTNSSRVGVIDAFMKKHHKNEYKISTEMDFIRSESKTNNWDYIVSIAQSSLKNAVLYIDIDTFLTIMHEANNEELTKMLDSSEELRMSQNEIDDLFFKP
ncbi:MAG: hypothetical protein JNM93_02790 [Bacteriovoracaceae bacterium]|nr:hypothetical protein [Bacteriovoracaceae bacterium]